MPPKRKRSTAQAAAAKISSSGSTSTKTRAVAYESLLHEWKAIAQDKARCAQLLKVFLDGKGLGNFSVNSAPNDHHLDCYWLILATNVANRLASILFHQQHQPNHPDTIPIASTLSTLMYYVAKALLNHDKYQLERATTPRLSRSILGRAILTITTASLGSLKALITSTPDDTARQPYIWASLAALEMVIFFASPNPKSTTIDGWHHALDAFNQQIDDIDISDVAARLEVDDSELSCLEALSKTHSITSPSKRRRQKQSTSTAAQFDSTPFDSMLEDASKLLECRVTVRRWPSLAFAWFLEGPQHGFVLLNQLLTNRHHWASTLNCVKTATAKQTSKAKASANKKPTLPYSVPGNVALVYLAAHLMDIVAEAGNNAGARMPAGGLDQYISDIYNMTKKSKLVHSQTKPKLLTSTAVTVHLLIQAHAECMTQATSLLPSTSKKGKFWLVNDEKSGTCINTTDYVVCFYPSVHKSIETICGMATAQSVGSQMMRKLLALSAIYALQALSQNHCTTALDAKLCSFSTGQLNAVLATLLQEEETVGDTPTSERTNKTTNEIKESFATLGPLLIPSLPKPIKTRKKKASSSSYPTSANDAGDSTLGGVFADKNETSTQEEVLFPMFLSAVHDAKHLAVESLYNLLLAVLEACYDNATEEDIKPESKATKGSKRKAHLKAVPQQLPSQRKRINSTRAGLASDVCNALTVCLNCREKETCGLPAYLRSMFSVNHIIEFVQLGNNFHEIMTRTSNEQNKSSEDASARSSFFNPASDYNLYERTLWSAHINLCQTVGRGSLTFSLGVHLRPDLGPVMKTPDERSRIFQAVAKSCGDGKKGKLKWPLALPAVHHALVTSNLTSEPEDRNVAPERIIVGGLIASIADALADPASVSYGKWLGEEPTADSNTTTDESTPLAICDARLLAVALTRLPHTEQIEQLGELSNILAAAFSKYSSGPKRDIIINNAEVAHFLARVVTTHAALMNIVSVGRALQTILYSHVGPCQFHPPPLYTLRSIRDGNCSKDGNWYKRDSCFMGVFGDWESPAIEDPAVDATTLPDFIISKSEKALESALEIGFACAGRDFGHLLFAAWNSYGQRKVWDSDSLETFKIEPFNEDLSSLYFQLRHDICGVHLRTGSRTVPDSLLGRALKKQTQPRAQQLKDTLEAMILKAEKVTDYLLKRIRSGQDVMPYESPLLSGICVYLSFIMAMHTKSSSPLSNSPETKGSKRSRQMQDSHSDIELLATFLTEEDSDEEDTAVSDGTKADILSHLHDACVEFGAAPTHPDWLDAKCVYRDGISSVEAWTNSSRALACLEKIAAVAHDLHENAMKECMAYSAGKDAVDEMTGTAVSFCGFLRDTNNDIIPSATSMNDFKRSVATAVELQPEVLDDFFNDSASTGWLAAKEAWMQNSSQQVLGMIQTNGFDVGEVTITECRAAGEWELLITESVLAACAGCGMEESDHTVWKSFKVTEEHAPRILHAFRTAERWRWIQDFATSQLMPVSALLRFSIAGGKGRRAHPWSRKDAASANKPDKPITLPTEQLVVAIDVVTDEQKQVMIDCVGLLVRIAARCNGHDSTKRSCAAVMANLLVECTAFDTIETQESISSVLNILSDLQLRIIALSGADKDDARSSLQFLVLRLLNMIKKRGDRTGLQPGNISNIFSFMSANDDILASVLGVVPYTQKHLFVDRASQVEGAMMCFFSILSREQPGKMSCSLVSSLLGRLVELEAEKNDTTIRKALSKILNGSNSGELGTFVAHLFPDIEDSTEALKTYIDTAQGIAQALCFLARTGTGRKGCLPQKLSLRLCDQMIECSKDGVRHEVRDCAFGVLCLYATRSGSLATLGSMLVHRFQEQKRVNTLLVLECFLAFVRSLDSVLLSAGNQDVAQTHARENVPPSQRYPLKQPKALVAPRACSFVLRNGFFQQHWYNCYTCGLVFDKGCCTVCALTCHRGHEISYSRYSSFFCDCGAEDASADHGTRSRCQCITRMSQEKADALFQEEDTQNYLVPTSELRSHVDKKLGSTVQVEAMPLVDRFATVALCFSTEATSSIDQVKNMARNDMWVQTFFAALKDQLQTDESQSRSFPQFEDVEFRGCDDIVAAMLSRRGNALNIQQLQEKALVPVKAARAGTFNVKISVDSTTDRMKRAMLSRHRIARSVVAADSRGNLFVAEPCSLIITSLLPLVNTKLCKDPLATQLGRSQITLLGHHSIRFNIVGMRLCQENERRLVLWGTSEACVITLQECRSKIERTFFCTLDLDPHESETDFLLKCDWIPDSQSMVAVSCGSFVKVFDISRLADADNRLSPILTYNVGYDGIIRDTCLVGTPIKSKQKGGRRSRKSLILFSLMDTGRVHQLDVPLDRSGDIAVSISALFIESSSKTIEIPTKGLRSFGDSSLSCRSLGEGDAIDYLPRSNLLLYKCYGASVIALTISLSGAVSGSFELLPDTISSDVLGNGAEGYSVVGPYTHWTEISISGDGTLRLSCVGKSSSTKQPKLLCLEVSSRNVKVQEMSWSCDGSVLGLSLSTSFEGIVPFSAPSLSESSSFHERLYMCVMTSNGSMLIYGENDTIGVAKEEFDGKPNLPLTIFEKLLNVSDAEQVRYVVEGAESESAKTKLSSKNNSSYLMSPTREGSSFAVWLDGPVDKQKLVAEETPETPPSSKSEDQEAGESEELAIVALRILVGSAAIDCIPNKLFIEGRAVETKRDVKRWYDLPLTKEELLLSVRGGCVSFGVGPSFDGGSSSLIDAVEVYAIEKSKVLEMIPKTLDGIDVDVSRGSQCVVRSQVDQCIIPSVKILSSLYNLLKRPLNEISSDGSSLKNLVRRTALKTNSPVRKSVIELLENVESDPDKRQMFLDTNTLEEISSLINTNFKLLANPVVNLPTQDDAWSSFRAALETSFKSATSIALSRPENYISALQPPSLIARGATDLFAELVRLSLPFRELLDSFVHLVLAHLCVVKSKARKLKDDVASFDILSMLLTFSDEDVVELTCDAISSFINTHSPSSIATPIADLMRHSEKERNPATAPIAYRCDSCSLFPITDARYTLPEGSHDIDLCKKCYAIGRVYAERHFFSSAHQVIINGRSIGGGSKLDCAQMSQMESVAIAEGNAIVEQVEQALQEATSAAARTAASKMQFADESLQTEIAEPMLPNVDFDTLVDTIFLNLLNLSNDVLGTAAGPSPHSSLAIARLNPLLNLLFNTILTGNNETAHVGRGKRYASHVMRHIRFSLESVRSGPRLEMSRLVLMINYMRSLSRLVGIKDDQSVSENDAVVEIEAAPKAAASGTKKTDPRFVCNVHNVPAVRRRCSAGPNKNRRFYVCGMDRKQRCRYFKWADEPDVKTKETNEIRTRFQMEMEQIIWNLLSDKKMSQLSLSDQLCAFLEIELGRIEGRNVKEIKPSEVKSSGDQEQQHERNEFDSFFGRDAALVDMNDGAFCSREKVHGHAPLSLCKEEPGSPPLLLLSTGKDTSESALADKFVEASLDLVSTFSSTTSTGDSTLKHSRLFSLLCEISNIQETPRFRVQAKKVLRRMCGGDPTVYNSVRDHFVFGFQFKDLINHASSVLDGSLCVTEQARQCGDRWSASEPTWSDMKAGDLLGVHDLVSEDRMTLADDKKVGAVLDEILTVAKSRGENWRDFCSLSSLPLNREQRRGRLEKEKDVILRKFGCSPAITLMWMCCSVSGPNQVKMFSLLDIALSTAQERKQAMLAQKGDTGSARPATEAVAIEIDSSESGNDEANRFGAQIAPEKSLLEGPKALSITDIFAFAVEYVLQGRTAEVRRVASHVCRKLCRSLDNDKFSDLLSLLSAKPLSLLCELGCNSLHFLQLFQTLVGLCKSKDVDTLCKVGKNLTMLFREQMNLLICGKCILVVEGDKETSKKRFDLVECAHCHRVHSYSQRSPGQSKNQKEKKSKDSSKNKSTAGGPQWVTEQVRPFRQSRLEAWTDSTCSSEFALFVQLKCRLAISEVTLMLNEPRGRYAKTVVVSFSKRQVPSANHLKSEDYDHIWQPCATLNLTRGASRASCTLPIPVTAANLKFEYKDFYDRSSASRSSGGSYILFCPRCSRQVNNAHGVCGNCGECVFQCRRCRHIQYDRPDAFLCTECGHCSSGSFSYELLAGVASNAVAIVDDESSKRAVKALRATTTLHREVQNTLKERVRAVLESRKRPRCEDSPLADTSPPLKRMLLGDLPKLGDDDDGGEDGSRSDKAIGGRGSTDSSSNAASRARSLLRLARQLRSDAAGDRSLSRSRDLLVREFALGEVEDPEHSEIVGFFGRGERDMTDPLSRLVASITGRRVTSERGDSGALGGNGGGGDGNRTSVNAASSGNKKSSSKATAAECEKLYQLMREAERESFELQRRIDAWNRLEEDALQTIRFPMKGTFVGTSCSKCSGPVALNLLLLIVRIVQAGLIQDEQSVFTPEFIRCLFLEAPAIHKDLFELKRLAIVTFCTKSNYAATLILKELRNRLVACRDTASASILGKLLESEFPLVEEFVGLAVETLDEARV